MRAVLSWVCLALCGPLCAQQATYTFFGQGCASVATGQPRLVVEGLPRLGDAFTVGVEDVRTLPGVYWDVLVIGASNTTWAGSPLPLAVPFLSGCPVRVSLDIVIGFPAGALRSFTMTIPADPALTGITFYQQWITGWTQFGALPPQIFSTSDGGRAVVGI